MKRFAVHPRSVALPEGPRWLVSYGGLVPLLDEPTFDARSSAETWCREQNERRAEPIWFGCDRCGAFTLTVTTHLHLNLCKTCRGLGNEPGDTAQRADSPRDLQPVTGRPLTTTAQGENRRA